MMKQLHPELRYGFVINVHLVRATKVQERSSHPRQSLLQRFRFEIAQRHRQVGPVPKMRWKNFRFLECAHQRAHFLVVREVARFQRLVQNRQAGAAIKLSQINSSTIAQMSDMTKPAG